MWFKCITIKLPSLYFKRRRHEIALNERVHVPVRGSKRRSITAIENRSCIEPSDFAEAVRSGTRCKPGTMRRSRLRQAGNAVRSWERLRCNRRREQKREYGVAASTRWVVRVLRSRNVGDNELRRDALHFLSAPVTPSNGRSIGNVCNGI